MHLTKYSHACVRLERDSAVLVIDPGELSEAGAALDGVDAVLITHEHADHLDVGALTDALAKRPSVRIYTHPEVTPKLGDLAEVVTEVTSGQEFTAAGFPVRAFGGRHAEIHPDLPRVANLGYHVEDPDRPGQSVYHPGDSFDVPDGVEVHTLFVPVSGPWLRLAYSADFVRAVGPQRAYALHDGLSNDAGAKVFDSGMARLVTCAYERLTAGSRIAAR
jgi:L-ascorbate metabolism protein UlaG (beta-lactamase superfamily)